MVTKYTEILEIRIKECSRRIAYGQWLRKPDLAAEVEFQDFLLISCVGTDECRDVCFMCGGSAKLNIVNDEGNRVQLDCYKCRGKGYESRSK
jgi:hypothetical protein